MIKAIETHYNGYRFRSRLEARWAVFFDAAGVAYEYEREGFDLDGVRYLPDFWLPDLTVWIEIKGQRATIEERRKAFALSKHTGNDVYIFDRPDFKTPKVWRDGNNPLTDGPATFPGAWAHRFDPAYGDVSDPDLAGWCECTGCVREAEVGRLAWTDTFIAPHDGMAWEKHRSRTGHLGSGDFLTSRLSMAYVAARSARFEFGELPQISVTRSAPIRTVNPPSTRQSADVTIGDVVDHASYGTGIVTGCHQLGDDADVTIEFEDGSVRCISRNFARLIPYRGSSESAIPARPSPS